MNSGYIKLGIAALLPVVMSVIFFLLDRKTSFGKLDEKIKQVIYGVAFGALAVIGTEWGIPLNGAQVNCRDAAVLTAGLLFGAPAGIIAGVIGGVERWIAVAWGVGTFTRIACSISTIVAGIYSAALRKLMFEDKKPGVFISLAVGVVMEIFHLTMVFITNMATPTEAMAVVKACTVPMVVSNGLSVMLSAFFLMLLVREKGGRRGRTARISQTIQRWLLLTVVFAFLATSYFVYSLQDTIADRQTDSLLELAITDVADDIRDTSDANLLAITYNVAEELNDSDAEGYLRAIAKKYNLAEIHLIDLDGIIFSSTDEKYVGFDMASGAQSAEFLSLIEERPEYVQDYRAMTFDDSTMRKYAAVRNKNIIVQVGYDGVNFQRDIASAVEGITQNRHVGNTGYILIFNEKNKVVSAPRGFDASSFFDENGVFVVPGEDLTFTKSLDSGDAYCRCKISEGFYILSVLPVEEALQMRNVALYVNTFMEILVFAILFGLIYLLIKRVVVNRIKSINESLGKITEGDLGVVVNVRSSEEFASLSDDINSTVDTLKHYIDEASARIDKELSFAREIQLSALPNIFPAFPKRHDFDIHATMTPAKEVGGDFYDFYITHENQLNFLIADVSGKGIPAAMFMMRAKTELKTLTEADTGLSDVFTRGNAALNEGNDAGMFVTAWEGSLNLTDGKVSFANAGHNPPLVRHAGGKFEYLRKRSGPVLAFAEDFEYHAAELRLAPGDEIFLYTDGVTEAQNSASELYGESRLLEAINSREFASMRELCAFIKSEVDAFVGEAPQFDDITMLALRYSGTEPEPSQSILS